ncbi:hypothetical protein D3C78_1922110 [compost metagenome]
MMLAQMAPVIMARITAPKYWGMVAKPLAQRKTPRTATPITQTMNVTTFFRFILHSFSLGVVVILRKP